MSRQDDHGDDLPKRVTGPQHHAAGVPAVANAMRYALTQMGPARSYKTLTELNQKEGSTVPGAPGPTPPEHRHVAEFCENGAKAVAEEATTAAPTRACSRTTRSSELAAHSDYFIGKLGRLTEPMHLAPGDDALPPGLVGPGLRHHRPPAAGARLADEALFYTSGRTSNEAAFVYQFSCVRSGPTTCRTARTCATSRAARRWRRRSGSARAASRSRTSTGRPARGRRAEPRHQPPAHADRARDRQAAGRQDHRDQPAARGGTDPVQQPADAARHARPRARSSPICTCRSVSTATWRSSRPSTAADRAQTPRLDHEFIAEHTDGFDDR